MYTTWPKTLQEAFDRVWKRFVTDKAQRSTYQGATVYVSPVDPECRCAIGLQIPAGSPEEKEIMETGATGEMLVNWKGVRDRRVQTILGPRLWPALASEQVICNLQNCHDWSLASTEGVSDKDRFTREIKEHLISFAMDNKLEVWDAEAAL